MRISNGRTPSRLLSIMTVLAVAIALSAIPALGAGKGNGGPKHSPPVIEVTPIVGVADQTQAPTYVISGSGFKGRTAVFMVVSDDSAPIMAETDRAGTFEATWQSSLPGTYTIDAYQLVKNKEWDHAARATIDVG